MSLQGRISRWTLIVLLALAMPAGHLSAPRLVGPVETAHEEAFSETPQPQWLALAGENDDRTWGDRTRLAALPPGPAGSDAPAHHSVCSIGHEFLPGVAGGDWSLLRQGSLLIA